MKVLLLGEFSSLYKNLKEGLLLHGYEVLTASSGDGYKKIESDIDLSSAMPGFFGKVHRKFKPFFNLSRFRGFDIVQAVNPFIFYHRLLPNDFIFDYLIENNNKFFLSGAGDDAFFWKYGRDRLDYGPFDDFLEYDLKSNKYLLMTKRAFDFNSRLVNKSNGLIPIMYEYQVSYRDVDKCLNVIPIPINLNDIKYRDNRVCGKLVVFHGLNRYGFKGTKYVEEAFSYLSKKYPNDLELIIDGKMPLKDYLEVLKRTNVVIDQVNSHSLGVNGVLSLAMGKVVLGGAEPIALSCQNVKDTPVVNIKPNAKSIIDEIELILEKRSQITEMGFKSRQYAEENHCHIKIAKQYIDTWCRH